MLNFHLQKVYGTGIVFLSIITIKINFMKQRLLYIGMAFFVLGLMPVVSAQEIASFDADFASIDNELTKWDPVRGKWLGSSLKAMSLNQPIPDRTFPEDFSPAEMMRLVPSTTMDNVRSISQNQSQNSRDLLARERWSRIHNYTNRPTCKLVMGRTYGDPHLKSFDGAAYSFQTVGEFVLATANNNQFEIQVRQEPQSDNFSLNTAVAMQVGGDRLGIYAREKRDAFTSPVMLNGMPIEVASRTYYLPHGGTIRNSGRNYLVTWPSGETVSLDLTQTGGMSFMNVAVQIYPCASNRYAGLMGNANGDRNDDFNTGRGNSMNVGFSSGGSMSQEMEKERLAFLAKDFANSYRITPQTTLFDYGFGESTMTFTDYSYPRVHRTIHDIPSDRRTLARNTCASSGLRGDDLNACIYDQAFLNIEPVRPPEIIDRTDRVSLTKVDREVPNVNPANVVSPNQEVPIFRETREVPNGTINTKPIQTERILDGRIDSEIKTEPTKTSSKWTSRNVQDRKANNEIVTPSSTSVSPNAGESIGNSIPKRPTTRTVPISPAPTTKSGQRSIPQKEISKPARQISPKPTSPVPSKIGGATKTVRTIKRGG
jgi:hypothetical protein